VRRRTLIVLGILSTVLALAADAATPRNTRRRTAPVPTIDDIIDSHWSAAWCAPGGDYATITGAWLPEKFTRLGYGVNMVERSDTDPEFWKRAKDFRIDGSELRSMPKEPDGLYHLRGVVDAQIVRVTANESIPIGKPIGQLMDIYGPDCEVAVAPKQEKPPVLNPPQQSPPQPRPPQPAPKPPANICETTECSVLVRIMKGDGEPCASCPVDFSWSGMDGFGTGGEVRRLTDTRGFVEFRSPVRYLDFIATIVNRTGLILPLRRDVDTLGGTSITITTPYTGR
jgi:hypothetical protein